MLMEIANIHIQVSVAAEEVVCKEEDFTILDQISQYCMAWRGEMLQEETLEKQIASIVHTYREHNQLPEQIPLLVGVWLETPIPEPEPQISWDPVYRPELRVIQGGKNE